MTSFGENGQVQFSFFRPNVSEVRVFGDFAGLTDGTQMKSAGDGWWPAAASIQSGEYRFRYRADGEWFADYASNGVESVKTGFQSLLVVPRSKQAQDLLEETATAKSASR